MQSGKSLVAIALSLALLIVSIGVGYFFFFHLPLRDELAMKQKCYDIENKIKENSVQLPAETVTVIYNKDLNSCLRYTYLSTEFNESGVVIDLLSNKELFSLLYVKKEGKKTHISGMEWPEFYEKIKQLGF